MQSKIQQVSQEWQQLFPIMTASFNRVATQWDMVVIYSVDMPRQESKKLRRWIGAWNSNSTAIELYTRFHEALERRQRFARLSTFEQARYLTKRFVRRWF